MVPCPHPTPPPSRPLPEDKASRGHWNANVWEPGRWAGTKAGGTPGRTLPPRLRGCVTLDKSPSLG
jgi:hypothetical protein